MLQGSLRDVLAQGKFKRKEVKRVTPRKPAPKPQDKKKTKKTVADQWV